MRKVLFVLAFVLVWVTTGYYAHGYCLGDFTSEFPDQNHEPFCTAWGYSGGPVSLIAAGHEKFQPHALTKEQRWQEFQKLYPNLGREIFEQQENK